MTDRPGQRPAHHPDDPAADEPLTFRCRNCDHRFDLPGSTPDWQRCPNCERHTAIAWQSQGRRTNTLYWEDQ